MEEALTKAFPIHPSMENMAPSNFLGRVKDKKHPINNAMNGVPKKVKILINIGKESYSSGLYPYTDVNNELITIKMMGTKIGSNDLNADGLDFSRSFISSSEISGLGSI